MRYKQKLSLTSAASVLALMIGSSALGQTEQSAQSGPQFEEIIVTARRVEENIQSVPIAITTISENAILRQNFQMFSELDKNIPGLAFDPSRGGFGGPAEGGSTPPLIWLRGIRGVLAYFAEMPVDISGSGLMFDISNVEVLKGPQGTLFGLSTDGGAIVIQPTKPTNDLGGFIQAEGGTLGHRYIGGALNVPLVEDKLMVRAAIVTDHTDGYITDLATNQKMGDDNYWDARLSALFKPSDRFDNYTIGNYYYGWGIPAPAIIQVVAQNGLFAKTFGAAPLNALLAQQQQLGNYQIAGTSNPPGASSYFFNKIWTAVNTSNYHVNDDLTLRNIFGYQSVQVYSITASDTNGLPTSGTDPTKTLPSGATPTWTEEVQAQGKAFKFLTYTIGTFNSGITTRPLPVYSVFAGAESGTLTKTSADTHAVYGQGNFDLSSLLSGLTLTGGYRHTWDIRRLLSDRFSAAGVLLTDSGTLVGHFGAGSYTASLQYQANPDTMWYISNSRGYSSGGFNATAPAALQVYQPENLNNFEAGVKSQFDLAGMKTQVNFSGFYGLYNNVQVNITQLVQTPAGPVAAAVTTNGAQGISRGFDGEFAIIPTKRFEAAISADFVNTFYKQLITYVNFLPVSLKDLPFTLAPKYKLSSHFTYHLIANDTRGNVDFHTDYSWQSRENAGCVSVPCGPYDHKPAFGNLDFSLDWIDIWGRKGLTGTLYLTNATDNIWTNGGRNITALSLASEQIEIPRQFGAKIRQAF